MHLLNVAICLFVCATYVYCDVTHCNGKKYWWITNQKVYANDANLGATEVRVTFDEVFSSGSWDMIRKKELKQNYLAARLAGWTNVFSDSGKYRVIEDSNFEVNKRDGVILSYRYKNLKGVMKLGENDYTEGDLRYKFTATEGGYCKYEMPTDQK